MQEIASLDSREGGRAGRQQLATAAVFYFREENAGEQALLGERERRQSQEEQPRGSEGV